MRALPLLLPLPLPRLLLLCQLLLLPLRLLPTRPPPLQLKPLLLLRRLLLLVLLTRLDQEGSLWGENSRGEEGGGLRPVGARGVEGRRRRLPAVVAAAVRGADEGPVLPQQETEVAVVEGLGVAVF